MSRVRRKLDHIKHALNTGQARMSGFDDVHFVHQSFPNMRVEDIKLSTRIGELDVSSPIFINAMTGGGGEQTRHINASLAEVAGVCNIGIAVGSQMAAIKEPSERASYEVVRKNNPNGIVLANLGSEASVDQAKEAVDMLEANALQIHLNVIQELVMPEGDRDFIGALRRIEQIVNHLHVPVIVKEVGFGMSKETASQLVNIGIQTVDIGGFGGTNFSKIENERRNRKLGYFDKWGIPTTVSIAEVKQSHSKLSVIGSGGIQDALDIVKALALGASAVGIAGHYLKILLEDGIDSLISVINETQEDITLLMTALGVQTISSLQQVPIVVSGDTLNWLGQRGIKR